MQLEKIEKIQTQRDHSNRQSLVSRLYDLGSRAIERLQTKDYWVNVFSGWTYYTPTYLIQELVAGKEVDAIFATRTIGLGMHMALMDPIQKIRKRVAQKMGVTKKSPYWKKIAVNTRVITPIQSAAYASMLFGGMAISNEWDLEPTFYSWIAGTTLAAIHATIYGPYQDAVRSKYGLEKSIK